MNNIPVPRCIKISRKTSESKHDAAANGFFLSSKAPLGYRKWREGDPEKWDSRVLLIDEIAAPAVAECFERYAAGNFSYSDLSHLLAEKGFISASGHPFSRETIRLMLNNRTYLGQIEYKGSEVFPGKHEPLISQDLWNRVQEVRKESHVSVKKDG